jgi:cyclopropane-fatty-acyl-phospholipid synthase
MIRNVIGLVERGFVPDFAVRAGIRKLLVSRLAEQEGDAERGQEALQKFVDDLRRSPIAIHTDKANEQHYEVPPEFFKRVLGKRMKYSSCLYGPGVQSLDEAEEAMLALTCERAKLVDGQKILELGCGWGSLTLWMAEKYRKSTIVAVSNSAPQRLHIEAQARSRGLTNVRVVTCDMNDFDPGDTFDRVVSVEMFEHMRNYKMLFARIASWLNPDGMLFFHIFCHKTYAYPFETKGDDDWMAKHFFTGGIMPSDDLMLYFQDDLIVEKHWRVLGTHYAKTSEDWLANLDKHKSELLGILAMAGAGKDAAVQLQRWRVFFLACAELFGFRDGSEWMVSHWLFKPRRSVQ